MLWTQGRRYKHTLTSSQIDGCFGLRVEGTNIQEPGNKFLGLSDLGKSGEQYRLNPFIEGTISVCESHVSV